MRTATLFLLALAAATGAAEKPRDFVLFKSACWSVGFSGPASHEAALRERTANPSARDLAAARAPVVAISIIGFFGQPGCDAGAEIRALHVEADGRRDPIALTLKPEIRMAEARLSQQQVAALFARDVSLVLEVSRGPAQEWPAPRAKMEPLWR